jgi:hypothetical protein
MLYNLERERELSLWKVVCIPVKNWKELTLTICQIRAEYLNPGKMKSEEGREKVNSHRLYVD